MSSATFVCPHCDQSYPLKPVLIGKVVRCTSCKKPFSLRPDGIADKVDVPAPAPAPAPAGPSAEDLARAQAAKERRAAEEAKAAEVKARMAEARKSMAADLAQAAGKALESDVVKTEERKKKDTSRIARAATAGGTGGKESGTKRISAAILTGEGEREAANTRLWLGASLGTVAVIALLAWLLSLDSARTQALEQFVAEVPPAQNRYGQRAQTIIHRGWLAAQPGLLGPVAAFIDLGDVRQGRTIAIAPAAYGAALARLAERSRVPGTDCWVAPKDLPKAEAALATGSDPVEKRLAAARLAALTWSAIAKDLAAAGLDDPAIDALHLLLTHAPAPGAPDLAKRLLNGTVTLELVPLTGSHGSALLDVGGTYRPVSGAWTGALLREAGGPWRILRASLPMPATK